SDPSGQAGQESWKRPYREKEDRSPLAPAGEVKLCTSFSEFKNHFGDFSTDLEQRILAHAVYGFFNNGGRRCHVVRATAVAELSKALEKFETIDEIAIVTAPGQTSKDVRNKLVAHCEKTKDRFAILDCDEVVGTNEELDLQRLDPTNRDRVLPDNSSFAA